MNAWKCASYTCLRSVSLGAGGMSSGAAGPGFLSFFGSFDFEAGAFGSGVIGRRGTSGILKEIIIYLRISHLYM